MNITFEYLHQKIIEKPLEEGQDLGCFSDDSLSTKDSEENLDCSLKKTAISQKNLTKKLHKAKWISAMKSSYLA